MTRVLTKSLINALSKAGIKVENCEKRSFYCTNDILELNWYDSNGYAYCIHIQEKGAQIDPWSDGVPGFFVYKVKDVIRYMTAKVAQ